MVIAENLIELGEEASLAVSGGSVETVFVVDNELRGVVRNNKVELAIFMDSFGGTKPEGLVSNDCAAGGKVIIPAQEVWHVLPRNIRTVEDAVAMVCRGEAVEVVAARFRDDIDDAARGMAEFGFVTGGDDLKFRDGVLVELRGGPTIQLILIGQ